MRLQLDTYERELERYGGPVGIELAEAVFEADSEAALAIVELLEGDAGADARWRLALCGMHRLLLDLGFDLERRTALLRRARAAYGAEHHADVVLERGLGQRFRAERGSLEELLSAPAGSGHPLEAGLAIFARRSARIAPLAEVLAACAGQLTTTLDELAGSFLHMHANRVLRADQRAQELVLCDFLRRLCEAEAARSTSRRRGGRKQQRLSHEVAFGSRRAS